MTAEYDIGELVVYSVGGPDHNIFGDTSSGEIVESPPWTQRIGNDSIERTDSYKVKKNSGNSMSIMTIIPEHWIVGRDGESH
jgi:hypothetical protein